MITHIFIDGFGDCIIIYRQTKLLNVIIGDTNYLYDVLFGKCMIGDIVND